MKEQQEKIRLGLMPPPEPKGKNILSHYSEIFHSSNRVSDYNKTDSI